MVRRAFAERVMMMNPSDRTISEHDNLTAVEKALDSVMDPCMAAGGRAVSIVDLGLITRMQVEGDTVSVGITFTEVGCPFTHRVIDVMERNLRALDRFTEIHITPEWRPGWTPERMNERARKAVQDGQSALRLRLRETGFAPNGPGGVG